MTKPVLGNGSQNLTSIEAQTLNLFYHGYMMTDEIDKRIEAEETVETNIAPPRSKEEIMAHENRKKALLKKFKSLKGIKDASKDDLMTIKNINETIASEIKQKL